MQTKFTIHRNEVNPMVGSYQLELVVSEARSLSDVITEVEKALEDIKGMKVAGRGKNNK
jgi:hypothetical protein